MAITSFIPKLREYRKARKDRIAAQKEYEELVEKKQKEALDNKLKEIDEAYERFKAKIEENKKNDPMKAELERLKRMTEFLTKDIEGA